MERKDNYGWCEEAPSRGRQDYLNSSKNALVPAMRKLQALLATLSFQGAALVSSLCFITPPPKFVMDTLEGYPKSAHVPKIRITI